MTTKLEKLIDDILYDRSVDELPIDWNDFNDTEKRDLAAAYIEENNDIIFDLFANVHETSMAQHFIALVENRNVNLPELAWDLQTAIFARKDLQTLIEAEFDLRWRDHVRERQLAAEDYR